MALPFHIRRLWSRIDTDLRVFLLGYAVLLPFFLAPLVFTKYLPGLDLPFHLSTADLLSKGVGPESPYAGYYELRNLWAPYSAHYIALIVLAKLVGSIALAHNVVACLYVASLPLTLGAFLGVCGKSRIPALLAFPLAYNLCLHYGFFSFCLSLPALMALFAALAYHLQRPSFSWWSWAACAAAGVFLFLCHLQNLLFGLCGAAVLLVFCRASVKRRLNTLAALGPTFASLLYWNWHASFTADPNEQKNTLRFAWEALKAARLIDLGKRTWGADLADRMVGMLPVSVMRGFKDMSDVDGFHALMAVLAAYFLMGVIGYAVPRSLNPKPTFTFAGGLLMLGSLVAYLALPHHLWAFELMTFFPRFSVLVVLLLIALVPAGLRRVPWQAALLALVPALVLGVQYGRNVNRQYHAYRDEIKDFVTVLSQTPRDGKLMGIIFDRASKVMRIESALVGLPGFYVATKPAPHTAVPIHYCGMRHMPCAVAKPMPWPGPWNSVPFIWDEAYAAFDYFLIRHGTPAPSLLGPLANRVTLSHRQREWAVFKKKR
ncbi:MAG: hypothetical protein SF187_19120 [Deltaproteobacteria bacterium]|nr:hypothetical protein [Deltaproteobacteria bacterium]